MHNGCNLFGAKKGLPKFYFRQPLGNPTYSSPNLTTLGGDINFNLIIQELLLNYSDIHPTVDNYLKGKGPAADGKCLPGLA